MDTQEVLSLYESVAEITDKMLAAARLGDWDQLVALESRCTSQVEIIKRKDDAPQVLSPGAREQKVRIIKKILNDDREIRNLTEPWMAKLSVLINSAGTERKLAKAYGAHQSG